MRLHAKFRADRSNFCEFGLNMPIHALFGWVLGFDPMDGTQHQPISQKLNIWVITVLAVY